MSRPTPDEPLQQCRDGWEQICRFLDVPVPQESFPHLNDTAWYRVRTGLPPIESVP